MPPDSDLSDEGTRSNVDPEVAAGAASICLGVRCMHFPGESPRNPDIIGESRLSRWVSPSDTCLGSWDPADGVGSPSRLNLPRRPDADVSRMMEPLATTVCGDMFPFDALDDACFRLLVEEVLGGLGNDASSVTS